MLNMHVALCANGRFCHHCELSCLHGKWTPPTGGGNTTLAHFRSTESASLTMLWFAKTRIAHECRQEPRRWSLRCPIAAHKWLYKHQTVNLLIFISSAWCLSCRGTSAAGMQAKEVGVASEQVAIEWLADMCRLQASTAMKHMQDCKSANQNSRRWSADRVGTEHSPGSKANTIQLNKPRWN